MGGVVVLEYPDDIRISFLLSIRVEIRSSNPRTRENESLGLTSS